MERYTRWCSLRGCWDCTHCDQFLDSTQTDHFTADMSWQSHDPMSDISELTTGLTHLYKTVALDHQRGSSKHSVVGVLEAVSRDGYWNFDAATVRQLCSEVVYSRDGHPRAERHPVNEHITELLPEFPLTTLKTTRHTSETPRSPGPPLFTFTLSQRGYCSPFALSSTFGVPQLPDKLREARASERP